MSKIDNAKITNIIGIKNFKYFSNFSEKKICKVIDERGVEQDAVISRNNKNSFACLAATKFRKLK